MLSAGLRIGQVEERELDQESGKAKVFLRIMPEIKLYENAAIAKKAASLLGEYYLEIDPGSPVADAMASAWPCANCTRATRSRS